MHGLRANMKNRLMPMWNKIMLRKRYVIECINELLKNKASVRMNICLAFTADCFFDNKPQALLAHIENAAQSFFSSILSRTRVMYGFQTVCHGKTICRQSERTFMFVLFANDIYPKGS